MPHATKIATCNYCGTRAALVLSGDVRHELACSGCGAPLHDLKLMPMAAPSAERKPVRRSRTPGSDRYDPPRGSSGKRKPPKRKKRKSRMRWVLGEAIDLIEDIFD